MTFITSIFFKAAAFPPVKGWLKQRFLSAGVTLTWWRTKSRHAHTRRWRPSVFIPANEATLWCRWGIFTVFFQTSDQGDNTERERFKYQHRLPEIYCRIYRTSEPTEETHTSKEITAQIKENDEMWRRVDLVDFLKILHPHLMFCFLV